MSDTDETARHFPLLPNYRQKGAALQRRSIPWPMIAPHEAQALRNHGQTLQRLAERGGLSPGEACDVLLGHRWATTPEAGAVALLERLVEEWKARVRVPGGQA